MNIKNKNKNSSKINQQHLDVSDCFDCIDESEYVDETAKSIEQIKQIGQIEQIEQIKKIDWFDSIEYLKYSNPNEYDKLIIANSSYKTKHKEEFKLFKELGLILSTEKFKLEHYIKSNYKLVNKLIELNMKKLKENNIALNYCDFFTKHKIHEPIKIFASIKDQSVKGVIYDKAIGYVYDPTINFLTIVKSCKTVDDFSEIIIKNKILDSEEMINVLFKNQLNDATNAIDIYFKNMKPCKIIYSHETKTYGYPDFIADNWIIDVKTSKTKSGIINMKNYLQVVGYAVCANINNVGLYDIENGYIYKGYLSNEMIEKIKKILF